MGAFFLQFSSVEACCEYSPWPLGLEAHGRDLCVWIGCASYASAVQISGAHHDRPMHGAVVSVWVQLPASAACYLPQSLGTGLSNHMPGLPKSSFYDPNPLTSRRCSYSLLSEADGTPVEKRPWSIQGFRTGFCGLQPTCNASMIRPISLVSDLQTIQRRSHLGEPVATP